MAAPANRTHISFSTRGGTATREVRCNNETRYSCHHFVFCAQSEVFVKGLRSRQRLQPTQPRFYIGQTLPDNTPPQQQACENVIIIIIITEDDCAVARALLEFLYRLDDAAPNAADDSLSPEEATLVHARGYAAVAAAPKALAHQPGKDAL